MKHVMCTLALVGMLGCGSGGEDESATAPCASETFTLSGDLDGNMIDLELPLGSFGVTNTPGGPASVGFGTQGRLDLTYADALELGTPVAATGTIELPSESTARAGESLCLGQGTTITRAKDEALLIAVTFSLAGLANGSSCETPVAGALEACFAHSFSEDP
jgi:hypothetical protein